MTATPVDDFVGRATRSATGSSTSAASSSRPAVVDDRLARARSRRELRSRRCTTGPRSRRSRQAREALPDVPHVAVSDSYFHRDASRTRRAATRSRPSWRADRSARLPRARRAVRGRADRSAARRRLSSRRRLLGHGRPGRALGGHDDGLHAARGRRRWAPARARSTPVRSSICSARAAASTSSTACSTRSRACSRSAASTTRSRSPTSPTTSPSRSRRWRRSLGGLDVLAFSGGIGENRADVREAIAGAAAPPRRVPRRGRGRPRGSRDRPRRPRTLLARLAAANYARAIGDGTDVTAARLRRRSRRATEGGRR